MTPPPLHVMEYTFWWEHIGKIPKISGHLEQFKTNFIYGWKMVGTPKICQIIIFLLLSTCWSWHVPAQF